MRIAVNFLKKIQDSFFGRYDPSTRLSAVAHSLKDFRPILQDWMVKFNNKTEIDKLSGLRKELSELEEQALRNMDKVIERGERIEILVKKSENLADQSLDLRDTSRKVKNKMWWKNKKVMIGIIAIIVIVIVVVVIIIVA
jgi:vesicle-associated membrane protein 7